MTTSTTHHVSPVSLATSRSLAGVAMDAARAVGPRLRSVFRHTMDTEAKRDFHDLVTEYDRWSEETIREHLLAARPGSTIVGEEEGTVTAGDPTWYVDPIDGTSNFARGIAHWCVSIAAAVEGEVVAAAIYDPVHDHMFSADLDAAYLDGEPISVSAERPPEQMVVLSQFPTPLDLRVLPDALTDYRDLVLGHAAVRNLNSGALCLAHVAAGWADASFNVRTSVWDVAAGSFILDRAGGTYLGFADGREVTGPQAFRCREYVGTTGAGNVDDIRELLRRASIVMERAQD